MRRQEIWKSLGKLGILIVLLKGERYVRKNCKMLRQVWNSHQGLRPFWARQGTLLPLILLDVIMKKICNRIREKTKEIYLKAFMYKYTGLS
jgi:hypothetical protein